MTSKNGKSHAFWRLKRLRELKGVTLEELARRTGLTKSYLSKVERGISVPSIAAALKLAGAFDVGVGDLFGVDVRVNDFSVVRKNQRKPFSRKGRSGGAFYYEAIAPGLNAGHFEAFIMRPPLAVEPGRQKVRHSGQEMIFVLKGKIEVIFPHTSVLLAGGDTIVFHGQLPHTIVSSGGRSAETLVFITGENEQRD